jgi:hypothetical protein
MTLGLESLHGLSGCRVGRNRDAKPSAIKGLSAYYVTTTKLGYRAAGV